eukprot:TRINITY_DN7492_c1_g1_i2.p4 TRINITY_DN7492_c1_g1~~TRINITY_DN7492_c1_g1_i2.p4  ORF type:complete len:100 (+),score=17.90 TRINITY_DN7492_c1_g1_i2:89-388(+)
MNLHKEGGKTTEKNEHTNKQTNKPVLPQHVNMRATHVLSVEQRVPGQSAAGKQATNQKNKQTNKQASKQTTAATAAPPPTSNNDNNNNNNDKKHHQQQQ